jgi:hypothetical protein
MLEKLSHQSIKPVHFFCSSANNSKLALEKEGWEEAQG